MPTWRNNGGSVGSLSLHTARRSCSRGLCNACFDRDARVNGCVRAEYYGCTQKMSTFAVCTGPQSFLPMHCAHSALRTKEDKTHDETKALLGEEEGAEDRRQVVAPQLRSRQASRLT